METHLESNAKFNKGESVGFLVSEYEQCFEQMRHYNAISISLTKFVFTGFAAIASGAFALFKYLEGQNYQNIVIGGILLLTFVTGVIFLTLMLRNRVYFIFVARQVNSLRNYFLSNMDVDYIKYNVCYIDPSFPRAFNLWSTYTLLFFIVALINAVLVGVGSYLVITHYCTGEDWLRWLISLVIAVVLVVTQLIASIFYLTRYDRPRMNLTHLASSLTAKAPPN